MRAPGQNSDVDPAALSASARRRRVAARWTSTRRPTACAACPSPISGFARVDHHRPLRQGTARGRVRAGQDARAVRRPSSPSCWRTATSPVLLTRASRSSSRRPRWPATRAGRSPAATVVWRPLAAERPERVVVATAGTADGPVAGRVRDRPRAPTASRPSGSTTSAWPACTASSPTPTRSPRPTPSWSWPAWRARWPAWSAASRRRRSWPCPPAPATAPRSVGVTALLAMLSSCAAGRHGGRHRQRLRRRLRRRPACATSGPAGPDRRARRLVPLLLRHRRRHGAGRAARCRRRPRRGPGHRRPPRRRRAGRSSARPCSGRACRRRGPSSTRRRITTIRARSPSSGDPLARRHGRPAATRPAPAPSTSSSAWPSVEGRLHGVPVDEVHFHEVGALDAIVDVVGTCAALELLDVDEVRTSPGRRRSRSRADRPTACSPTRPRRRWPCWPTAGIAVSGLDSPVELATPTGAALLAALSSGCGPLPAAHAVEPSATAPAARTLPGGPTSSRW